MHIPLLTTLAPTDFNLHDGSCQTGATGLCQVPLLHSRRSSHIYLLESSCEAQLCLLPISLFQINALIFVIVDELYSLVITVECVVHIVPDLDIVSLSSVTFSTCSGSQGRGRTCCCSRAPAAAPPTSQASAAVGDAGQFQQLRGDAYVWSKWIPRNCSVGGICEPKRVKGAESLLGGVAVADFLLLRHVWLVRDTDPGHSRPAGSASLPGPRASRGRAQC